MRVLQSNSVNMDPEEIPQNSPLSPIFNTVARDYDLFDIIYGKNSSLYNSFIARVVRKVGETLTYLVGERSELCGGLGKEKGR